MGETPFSLIYKSEVVIPVEMGMPSYRVQYFDEELNEDALYKSLDLVEEMREKAKIRMASNKRKIE